MTEQATGEGVMSSPETSQGATPQSSSPTTSATLGSKETELLARIAELEHAKQNATEETARHRKKLTAYEQKEIEAQQAALTEIERANAKAQAKAQEAEEQIKSYKKQLTLAHIKLAAQEKGIRDPDLAALAVQETLEFGDDGMPTNISKALDDLLKNKPFLKKPEETATPILPAMNGQSSAPAIPAMNVGRTTIPSPGSLGSVKQEIPSWNTVYKKP